MEFSLKGPEEVYFSISVIIANKHWAKLAKTSNTRFYLYVMCIPKGKYFPNDLDEIRLANSTIKID